MKYQVKASDADGHDQTFEVEADDSRAAAAVIRGRGFFPFSVQQQGGGRATSPTSRCVSSFAAVVASVIKAHPRAFGAALVVFVLAVLAFCFTAEGRSFRQAEEAYDAGQYQEALNVVSSLSDSYQARPPVVRLKSDALLQLAEEAAENADYGKALHILASVSPKYQAKGKAQYLRSDCMLNLARLAAEEKRYDDVLSHLEGIPDTFMQYDDVLDLRRETTATIQRIAQEKRQEEEEEAHRREAARYLTLPDGSRARIPKEFYGKYWPISDYNNVVAANKELDKLYDIASRTGNLAIWEGELGTLSDLKANLMYLEIRESKIQIVPPAELRSSRPEHQFMVTDFDVQVVSPRTVRFTYAGGRKMEIELREGDDQVITLREGGTSREMVRFAGGGQP